MAEHQDVDKLVVAKLLREKGIRLMMHSCGCCNGVEFSLEIDGKMIVDRETQFNFNMFGKP